MGCDQCEMLSINGAMCHEIGCPNLRRQLRAAEAELESWDELVEDILDPSFDDYVREGWLD